MTTITPDQLTSAARWVLKSEADWSEHSPYRLRCSVLARARSLAGIPPTEAGPQPGEIPGGPDGQLGRLLVRDRRLACDAPGVACLLAQAEVTSRGQIHARKAHLEGADLRGVNLRGVDLTRCYLSEARLDGADLGGACLADAILGEACLDDADLSGADLYWVDAREASFRRANLHGATCSRACFCDADLTAADLRETRLTGANLVANLSGADLRGVDMRDVQMHGAILDAAQMDGAIQDSPPGYRVVSDALDRVECAVSNWTEGLSYETQREIASRLKEELDSIWHRKWGRCWPAATRSERPCAPYSVCRYVD